MIRKLLVVFAVVVIGAAGGMVGRSLGAGAGAPNDSLTDKVFFARANPVFTYNLTALAESPQTLMAVTVHTPSAGTAQLTINTQLWTDFPATTSSALASTLTIARCGVANTGSVGPGKCGSRTTYSFRKAQNESAKDATYPYSIQVQMVFTQARARTFYLNAWHDNYPGGLWADPYAHVEVGFTPDAPISTTAKVTVTTSVPGATYG